MKGFPSPRHFQQRAHEALRAGVRDGHRCQVLMAPTGGGKTYLGLRIAKEAIEKGKRVVFVCDRTTLINQTSETSDRYGLIEHGIIQSDHWRTKPQHLFQIASAQTLARRKWPKADVIIVDECHTQHTAWTSHIKTTQAVVIGLSATPFSPGLGKLFNRVVNAATMRELTDNGVLVPMRVLSCVRPDMTGAKTNSRGEWDDNEAAERGTAIIGDVVAEWLQHGERRKTIVFGSTIKHCEQLCAEFNAAGVMAAVFTSHTTPAERESLLGEYRTPDSVLRVLVSVEALAKGFDVPDVSCVVDCRPLRKSLSTAIQMWGRGLRSSPESGKTDCILLDHSGNIIRFREDFEDIYFKGLEALDDGEKLDKTVRKEPEDDKAPKGCPSCGFRPFSKRCMSCGFEAFQAPTVEAEAGEMREVVMLGGKQLGTDRAHVWAQVATYAAMHSAPDKRQGRAAHLYKEMTGVWPPKQWTVETTPRVLVTRAVENKIRAKNIAFKKACEKVAA
jgi:superfamily II DNA or RNA helicase